MVKSFEGWRNGPTDSREMENPKELKKYSLIESAGVYLRILLMIVWELMLAGYEFLGSLYDKPKSLKDRVCVVTGAGRGLGRELCLALAKEGAVIACVDINTPNNETTASMIKELGAKSKSYTTNVAIKKDIDDLIVTVEKDLGPIYLLVNNAAIVMPIKELTEEFVRAVFNVNILGSIWATEAVLPRMRERKEGHIVNINSEATFVPFFPLKIYSATKSALFSYSQSIRGELLSEGNQGICITSVHPTFMNSSQDYLTFINNRDNLFIEMETVVEATISAIKYKKALVAIPACRFAMLVLSQLLPLRMISKCYFDVTLEEVNFPDKEQYSCLPSGRLVKSCGNVQNDEKSK